MSLSLSYFFNTDPFAKPMRKYQKAKKLHREHGKPEHRRAMLRAEHEIIALGGSLLGASRHSATTSDKIKRNLQSFYRRTGTSAFDYVQVNGKYVNG